MNRKMIGSERQIWSDFQLFLLIVSCQSDANNIYVYFAICTSTEESRRLCGLIPSEHNLCADLLSVPKSTLGK